MGYISSFLPLIFEKGRYTDLNVVLGIQQRHPDVEEWFYRSSRKYFMEKFNSMFRDKDGRQEVFQESFIHLWTEITDGKIAILGEKVCRRKADGRLEPMTCSLMTFLMAIARYKYKDLLRSTREDVYGDIFEQAEFFATKLNNSSDIEYEIREERFRIVSETIETMPKRCREILTMFYCDGLSLDEIMLKRNGTSKDGLKTAKNKCMTSLKERIALNFAVHNI